MALFGRKKKEEVGIDASAAPVFTPRTQSRSIPDVLLTPRITEKATLLQEGGAYVFNIAPSATKRDVVLAVSRIYNVSPRTVRIVSVRRKMVRNPRTGKMGVKGGGKKAYVFLRKGDTITLT